MQDLIYVALVLDPGDLKEFNVLMSAHEMRNQISRTRDRIVFSFLAPISHFYAYVPNDIDYFRQNLGLESQANVSSILSFRMFYDTIGIEHRTITSVILVQGTKTTKLTLVPIFSFNYEQL